MTPNAMEDIWSNIPIGNPDECWPWRGKTFPHGYGKFNIGQTSIGAHVAAYRTVKGNIPHGLYVMHECNNKQCCNPNHLTVGTNSENQRHASASRAWKAGASGIHGVTFDRARNYWVASGYRNGKRRNLYTGPHKEKAISARQKWEAGNLITFERKADENL